MLITTEVEIRLSGKNITYYEGLGYVIHRRKDKWGRMKVENKTKLKVKIEDLPDNSSVKVDVKCDNCGEIIKNVYWYNYKRYVHEDEHYYCGKCAINLYGKVTLNTNKLKNKDSFAQWGVKELGKDFLKLYWDYDKNTIDPNMLLPHSNKKVWIFCQSHEYHGSYEIMCNEFANGTRCPDCVNMKIHEGSFAQFYITKYGKDFLEKYWDYTKNTINPYEIAPSSNKKVWLICQEREYHDSYKIACNHFTSGKRCPYCVSKKIHPLDSFAQYHIDNTDKNFLEKYWDYEKNIIDPYTISTGTTKYVWIKCQEVSYHGSYETHASSFTNGNRCSYCVNRKVHILDSIGTKFPQILKIWSDKNKKSPYEYSPGSEDRIWLKCSNNNHEDYQQLVCVAISCELRCPSCSREKFESMLQEKVRKYINELGYSLFHEKNCSIVPKNPKTNYALPFDNEIKELNLLCEVNGKQHYELPSKSSQWVRKGETGEQCLHRIKLHDRYKRLCANSQNYNYLEIPYWTEKDESYKKLIDDKIQQLNNNLTS